MLVYKIEDQLQSAKTIIENALNKPDVLKKLELSKFDHKQFTHGKTLLEKVLKLQKQQEKELERQKSFAQVLDIDRKLAYKEYLRHKKIARAALKKNPELAKALRMDGANKSATTGWLEQALVFYKNVAYITKYMAEQGVEEAELIQLRVMVEALNDARHAHLKLRKVTQEAIIRRDKAFNELQQWMYKFHTVAQIVLQDDLHTLEALGLELES